MEDDMIFEEQTEKESAVDEVLTNEEQTEQDATNSLDDILAGVNELLEQSSIQVCTVAGRLLQQQCILGRKSIRTRKSDYRLR